MALDITLRNPGSPLNIVLADAAGVPDEGADGAWFRQALVAVGVASTLWATPPVPVAWGAVDEVPVVVPTLADDDPGWQPPAPWTITAVQLWLDSADAVQVRGIEDASYQPPAPWPDDRAQLWLDAADAIQVRIVEDGGEWAPPPAWPVVLSQWVGWPDEAVPVTPTIVEEPDYVPPGPWPDARQLLLLDAADAVQVRVVEEPSWAPPAPWAPVALPLVLWPDEPVVPAVTTVVDEDAGWTPPAPSIPPRGILLGWGDDLPLLTGLVDEDRGWIPPPAWTLVGVRGLLWDADEIVPQPAAFGLDDVDERPWPPPPWPGWRRGLAVAPGQGEGEWVPFVAPAAVTRAYAWIA